MDRNRSELLFVTLLHFVFFDTSAHPPLVCTRAGMMLWQNSVHTRSRLIRRLLSLDEKRKHRKNWRQRSKARRVSYVETAG